MNLTKNKRWAATGLFIGMTIGGGALANALVRTQSTTSAAPQVSIASPAPSTAAPAVSIATAASSTAADATDTPGAPEAADATETAGGVDCENGLVKGTTTQCDGGSSDNQDDGSEGPETSAQK